MNRIGNSGAAALISITAAFGHDHERYGAAEPVTMLALGVGAGAAGDVAWRVRRKC